ncbi:MAG TPA: malto-oligosyltrehalose trehalohydrolase [Pseudoxanthomonas sp.]|nr:malto-oligosyltrehalose trehalohydrolase [Pseudoxanthomonas sp.]
MNFAHRLPFGAQIEGTHTRFRVWAPSCRSLAVQLEGGSSTLLAAGADGFFEGAVACGAGARYRYVVDDGSALADPASRAQDGGADGPSVIVDAAAYRWQHPQWRGRPWTEAVAYELHAGAFGGFAGIRARLPELADLGVTAIQLMPIAQFPGTRNWGYDGVLPYAPAACYGSPDELKAMIDAAHGLSLMVMLDVVYNHFGPDGNVMPRLAAPFFRDDLETPWGSSIDFRRPQVRDFFTHNALYWLMEYRFDGLRLDAVHAISERDWLLELARTVRATVEPGRHVHLVLENEHNDAGLLEQTELPGFDAQWNDDAHHVLHVLLTGEDDAYYADYSGDPNAGLARWLGEGFVYQGQACTYRDGEHRGQPSAHLPPTAFVNCLQNHDQVGNRALGDRLSTLADADALRVATAVLLLAPQIPMLFMGEEWNSKRPFLYFTDHRGDLADAVREGRRREFARFPAFQDPERRLAIPDPNALKTFEASIPDFDQASSAEGAAHRRFVQRLLRIRRERIVPRLEGARSLGVEMLGDGAICARWRMGDGAQLSLWVNLGGNALDIPAPPALPEALFELPGGAAEAMARGHMPGRSIMVSLTEANP